jgi:hypothetical protein
MTKSSVVALGLESELLGMLKTTRHTALPVDVVVVLTTVAATPPTVAVADVGVFIPVAAKDTALRPEAVPMDFPENV